MFFTKMYFFMIRTCYVWKHNVFCMQMYAKLVTQRITIGLFLTEITKWKFSLRKRLQFCNTYGENIRIFVSYNFFLLRSFFSISSMHSSFEFLVDICKFNKFGVSVFALDFGIVAFNFWTHIYICTMHILGLFHFIILFALKSMKLEMEFHEQFQMLWKVSLQDMHNSQHLQLYLWW